MQATGHAALMEAATLLLAGASIARQGPPPPHTFVYRPSPSMPMAIPMSAAARATFGNLDSEDRMAVEFLSRSAPTYHRHEPVVTETDIETARLMAALRRSTSTSPPQGSPKDEDDDLMDFSDHENAGRGKWTKEEDSRLGAAVKEFGDSRWKAVANYVGTRSASQCLHRWKYSLKPSISRNKWTQDEDERLVAAVAKHGAHWSLIAQVMGSRTGAQCRERFCNKLDPSIYRGAWTPEEDQQLRDAVAKQGYGRWAHIAKVLNPPRTDYQIRKRWYLLSRRAGVDPTGSALTSPALMPSTPMYVPVPPPVDVFGSSPAYSPMGSPPLSRSMPSLNLLSPAVKL